MKDVEKVIDDLVYLSRESALFCVGMEGNVSAKFEDNIFIKASGDKLKEMSTDSIVRFDFNGKQLSRFEKKGSMELGFHTFLLGFENINFVSHTHPTNTLKILSSKYSKEFSEKRFFPDQVIFNGTKSCLVPYSKPGNDLTLSIKKQVKLFVKKEKFFPKLILLENHGIICCGNSVDECLIMNEICEKSAEIYIGAKILGSINFLDEKSINNLVKDKKEQYRKSLI